MTKILGFILISTYFVLSQFFGKHWECVPHILTGENTCIFKRTDNGLVGPHMIDRTVAPEQYRRV